MVTTALYRRYRPETFGEMIGQSQVTEPAVLDDGHVRVPTGAGLGVEIDDDALEAFTVARETLRR